MKKPIFNGQVVPKPSKEELEQAIAAAQKRFEKQNPHLTREPSKRLKQYK